MQAILKYMKERGEQLDAEIAAATRIPLTEVRLHLSELSERERLSCATQPASSRARKAKACCAGSQAIFGRQPRQKSKSQGLTDRSVFIREGASNAMKNGRSATQCA